MSAFQFGRKTHGRVAYFVTRHSDDAEVILMLEEQLRVVKQQIETGRVRVRIVTETDTTIANAELQSESFEVERIPIGRHISDFPEIVDDGDTMIVPVIEEVLVVEKRLILKEELHIRRLRSSKTIEQPVVLRRQRAEIERLPALERSSTGYNQPTQKESTGMPQLITAMFKNRADAEIAKADLETELQLPAGAVELHAQEAATVTTTTSQDTGILAGLRNLFVPEEDRSAYAAGIQRGAVLVSAEIDESHINRAYDILDRDGAVDLDQQQSEWSQSDRTVAGSAAMTSSSMASGIDVPPPPAPMATSGRVGEEIIPIVEERLRVGKRDVERGRVRVRSYIVETPVEEQVTLRSEHVELERRPVDRELTAADVDLFRERVIEATETAEEAVIAKDVRVKEELVLRKDVVENVETVRDTVRRTEVEVEDNVTREGHSAAALKTQV
jgi:uncharacterized protein (TIGR02271 family)